MQDTLGWQGTKAIIDAATTTNYNHITSIRLWAGHIQDEGVRIICGYIVRNKGVETLELLNCDITPLGCEYLNKALTPKIGANLQIIKLDHNAFGSEGLNILAENLSKNSTAILISLQHCNIDESGADALFEILIYQSSKLEELNLSGNSLKNEGIVKVL